MKHKKIEKKLTLSKTTIIDLSSERMNKLRGGESTICETVTMEPYCTGDTCITCGCTNLCTDNEITCQCTYPPPQGLCPWQ